MKKLVSLLIASFVALACVHAQVQTITLSPGTNTTGGTLTISSNSYACLKSFMGANGNTYLNVNFAGTGFAYPSSQFPSVPLVIAGPATIQIAGIGAAVGFATFSVEPTPFPPNKAVTVGAYSGNVQVTMQMSTDLVNWTTATNAAVYTNSPDARFFRIQLVTNASP